ncbi:MAG: dTDP-4-dehydrorhamnose 3,5-epimerase, partial [Gaiellales bacterium]|nr:dTDP-4-dehydrorhamnose 3,5-epimerase [Gaiellales bacterium]
VLYDDRERSQTKGKLQELFVGDQNYVMVRIPPMLWNGVKGIGAAPAMIANCASHPHDPGEISRLDPFSDRVPYDWSLRHG